MTEYDVIIVGAGAIGAASAYFAADAGLSVLVLDRGSVASGTSSHGEGNVLVSDKEAGPELDLAHYSDDLWHNELAEFGPLWEFQDKGGVVVSRSASSMDALSVLAGQQRDAGITAEMVDADAVRELEPHITSEIAGGAWYPEDAQVQPILAAWHLLRLARAHGATLLQFCEVRRPAARGRPGGRRLHQSGGVPRPRGGQRRWPLGRRTGGDGPCRHSGRAPARIRHGHRARPSDRLPQGLRRRVRR
jgi:glycine/D-amino acid oxidase-like deaminating enzyme